MKNSAQGTIEYLVIIAIVIVIALAVVVLVLGQTSSVSETDQKATNLAWKSKEVKIMDFAVTSDGVGTIVLSSGQSDEITITSIVVESVSTPVSGQVFFSSTKAFSLTNLPGCLVAGSQAYSITLNYTTREGLEKSTSGVFYANCLGPSGLDTTPPVVTLTSPNGVLESKTVEFSFNATDDSSITACTLYAGSDSNTYTEIINGDNTVTYTFGDDIPTTDWNVICIDSSGNQNTIDSSLQFSIATAPPSIAVYLSAPQDKNVVYERNVSFVFTPQSSNGELSSCTLNIGSDSNTYTNLTNGSENTISYTLPSDSGYYMWDINCSNSATWGISASRAVSIGVNAVLLSTCQQLQAVDFNSTTRGLNYIQIQDIDCYSDTSAGGALYNSGLGFKPIGGSGTQFNGKFNGAGYIISGLNINRPTTDYVGLFGYTSSTAVIQGVNIKDATITGRAYVGSVIGDSMGSVLGISASFDSISASGSYLGGLIGLAYGSSNILDFNDFYADINSIRGTSYVGGLVGGLANFTSAGGVRFNQVTSTINDRIYASGSYAGGVMGGGGTLSTTIRNATADVNYIYAGSGGDTQFVGGIVGQTDGNVYSSSVEFGEIDINKSSGGYGYFGGLAGKVGFIENSFSLGDINSALGSLGGGTSYGYIGGLAGFSTKGVNKSYSRGTYIFAAKDYGSVVGGLVGRSEGPVYDSNAVYNSLQGYSKVGGLIGSHLAVVGNNLSGLFADVNVVSASYNSYSYVGGLVGELYGYNGLSDFNDSSARIGSITGGTYLGGAVGVMGNFASSNTVGVRFNDVNVEITDKVSGVSYVSGFIGQGVSIGSVINNSSTDVNYLYGSGSGYYFGGLAGYFDGNIYNSHATVDNMTIVKTGSDTYAGGLAGKVGFVGESWSRVDINASGGVYSGRYIGGLAGYSTKGISSSYSLGNYISAEKSDGSYVGGLAGRTEGPVYDSNTIFDAVRGYSAVGGLIGSHSVTLVGNNLSGLFADVNVVSASYNSYSYVGGLVGEFYGYRGLSDFNDSSARVGLITGGNYVGGIFGAMNNFASSNTIGINFNRLSLTVSDGIYSTGGNVGGLGGNIASIGSTIRDCHFNDVNYIYALGSGSYFGGLVGFSEGNIYNSSFEGKIDLNRTGTGDCYVGGLAGKAGFISNSWTEVDINEGLSAYSGKYVGGLVGYATKGIAGSYSKGNYIFANKAEGSEVGGLAGRTEGSVSDSNAEYNEIAGYVSVGGLIGNHIALNSSSYLRNVSADTNFISATRLDYSYVGGVVGQLYGASGYFVDINDVSANVGRISGGYGVGGLFGNMINWTNNATTGALFNRLSVKVSDRLTSSVGSLGGLIGESTSIGTVIRDSNADINYIYGSSSIQYVGGLAGKMDGNIYDSFALVGRIDINKLSGGLGYFGGLAGSAGFVSGCFSDVDINTSLGTYSGGTSYGGCTGGLVGGLSKGITNSYSKGDFISSTKSSGGYVGGLAGYATAASTITNSYSSIGSISAGSNSYISGTIGYGGSYITAITNVFSTSTVTSTGSNVGQLIGSSAVSCAPSCITNTYYLNGSDVMLYSSSPSTVASTGSNYFKGNLTNSPLSSWSTSVWAVRTNDYPSN